MKVMRLCGPHVSTGLHHKKAPQKRVHEDIALHTAGAAR